MMSHKGRGCDCAGEMVQKFKTDACDKHICFKEIHRHNEETLYDPILVA